jgi:hypothetical protein
LRFWHWFNINPYSGCAGGGSDYGYVQIKIGSGTWQTISLPHQNFGGGWTNESIDLSAYADSVVQVGFLFTSNDCADAAGWYIDDLSLITGPIVFNTLEDWEGGMIDWYAERGVWQVGVPTSGPGGAHSGVSCAATVLDGNYPTNASSRLISPRFTVPSASQNPRLRFWHWFNINPYSGCAGGGSDYGYVQIKIGSGTWQDILGPFQNSSTTDSTYIPADVDLSPYADSVVQVGFLFTSNDCVDAAGWYVDDVELMDSLGTSTIGISVSEGWNMISNPVTNPIPGDSVKQIYPTSANAYAYEFSGGYVPRWRLENGKGYWEKFPSAVSNPITGTRRTRDSISVAAGWNMVGSITNSVDTSTIVSIPPGLRASNWYGYGVTGYIPVTQLIPGQGYWVRSNGAGQFVLANPPLSRSAKVQASALNPSDVLNTLTITDNGGRSQTLFFGTDASKLIQPSMYDMPPLPPVGAFDARCETSDGGSMVQTHGEGSAEFPVTIQSDEYPLTVSWKVNGTASYELTAGSGSVQTMRGEGTMKISNSDVHRLFLKLTGNGQIPKEYALSQNYPNPFNPLTAIKYDLPKDSRVNLKVFNILGQEVTTLVNEEQKAGYRSVQWNASNVASGVYFYRIQAGDFIASKKLLLLR